jgi:hypothetical protein
MAIDRGLYSAPEGLEPEVDIEMVMRKVRRLRSRSLTRTMVTLDDGSMEITIIPDANIGDMTEFDANLAEFLEDNQLNTLANDLIGLRHLRH